MGVSCLGLYLNLYLVMGLLLPYPFAFAQTLEKWIVSVVIVGIHCWV
jgi:hypothetical protein